MEERQFISFKAKPGNSAHPKNERSRKKHKSISIRSHKGAKRKSSQ